MGGCYIEDNVSKLKSKMNDNKVIILVYAPWCGHCNEMKNDWQKVTDHLDKRDDLDGFISRIQIEEVPKLEEPGLEDIMGVPTIVYMNKGNKESTFEGKRDAKHIEDWILEKLHKGDSHKDLGKETEDSIVVHKRRRKPTVSTQKRKSKRELTNVADKVKRLRTMYGGYNWQKSSSIKKSQTKKSNSNSNSKSKRKLPSKKKSPTKKTINTKRKLATKKKSPTKKISSSKSRFKK